MLDTIFKYFNCELFLIISWFNQAINTWNIEQYGYYLYNYAYIVLKLTCAGNSSFVTNKKVLFYFKNWAVWTIFFINTENICYKKILAKKIVLFLINNWDHSPYACKLKETPTPFISHFCKVLFAWHWFIHRDRLNGKTSLKHFIRGRLGDSHASMWSQEIVLL